jgi:hypothetical protein
MTRARRLVSMGWVVIIWAAIATTTSGCTGCPTALLEGELMEQSGELVIVSTDGRVEHIIWPFGYDVRAVGESLVLADLLGNVKARPGDTVRLGGGESESGTFKVCGQLDVEPASMSRR